MKKRHSLAAFFAAALASIGLAASAAQPDKVVSTQIDNPVAGAAEKQLPAISVTAAQVCDKEVPAQYNAMDGVTLQMSSNVASVQYGKYHGAAPNGTPIMRTSSPTVTFDPRTAKPVYVLSSISSASQANVQAAVGRGHHDASAASKFSFSNQPFAGIVVTT